MVKLTPRKYIQTKARSLPVYKCLVTVNWEDTKLANIVVMRKHVTGNLTIGYYLVDLLCLGVKDTHYHFNISSLEADEIFETLKNDLTEVDYQLVHNIVFAGHDFAMEFDIPPHKDFSLTKYILEEDNDEVPLMEIATGDTDGKPHLMINSMGEGRWALGKLKKNAGEGNYYYTEGVNDDEEDDNYDDKDFEEADFSLDEIQDGELTPLMVKSATISGLHDKASWSKRELDEQLTISLEIAMRFLEEQALVSIISNEALETTMEYNLLDDAGDHINSPAGLICIEELDEAGDIESTLSILAGMKEDGFRQHAEAVAAKYADNLFALTEIYLLAGFEEETGLQNSICNTLSGLTDQYPYAALFVALNAKINNYTGANYDKNILAASNIHKAFPGYQSFGFEELHYFWIGKILLAIDKKDVSESIFYYKLLRECNIRDYLLIQTQIALMRLLKEDF